MKTEAWPDAFAMSLNHKDIMAQQIGIYNMDSSKERITLLKWVAKNTARVVRIHKTVEKLREDIQEHPHFQYISLNKCYAELTDLSEAMGFMDKLMDSEKFVNEGLIEAAQKRSKQ
jgi:predicted translin family RNA/ssDNA-binding protein